MKPLNTLPLYLAAALTAISLPVSAQDIQAERERWALHARDGQTQLAESVAALHRLYQDSGDRRVRADLIALLVRQGNGAEALKVCDNCRPEHYSLDELQNLAKAARDNKQFSQAQALYLALQRQDPDMKIGFLGGALVAGDLQNQAAAQEQIAEYRRRFGDDADIRAAENYSQAQSQTLTERMNALQQQLAEHPGDKNIILQLYRTAAQLRAFPVQEHLVQQYPQHFSDTDRLWLLLTESVDRFRAARADGDKVQLQAAYDSLSQVVERSQAGSAVHTQALRDRMAVAVALQNDKQALRDYNELARQGEQPEYVQLQYADALSMNANPLTVRQLYDDIAKRQQAESSEISPALTEKLVQVNADAGYYSEAQRRNQSWNPKKRVADFTRTNQVENPYYDKQYFWNARLEAWNGNIKGAIKLMDNWLAEHPGDPWAMALRGELAQWNGREDEALNWFQQAREQLSPQGRAWLDANIGGILAENGNWAGLKEMTQTIDRNNPDYQGFWQRYDDARAAQLNISGGITRATSPKDSGNEWVENATLYSPRSAGGHRAYVTQQAGFVPNHGNELRYGRVGVGGEFSFYPVTLNMEAGHGTQLNDKAYFNAGASWRVNEQVSLNLRAAKNSANTPAKALSQNVYADEYSLSANYTPSAATSFGTGVNVMPFDDDNLRRSAYVWVSQLLMQHNRWRLNGSLWADYSRNRDTPSAYYYNPRNSKSASGDLNLSYTMPLSNGIRLTQSLGAGIGRYWQADHQAENTWMLKYGHDWNLGKSIGLSYEVGRKQAIYDGAPEFQNFGNVNLNVKFK